MYKRQVKGNLKEDFGNKDLPIYRTLSSLKAAIILYISENVVLRLNCLLLLRKWNVRENKTYSQATFLVDVAGLKVLDAELSKFSN